MITHRHQHIHTLTLSHTHMTTPHKNRAAERVAAAGRVSSEGSMKEECFEAAFKRCERCRETDLYWNKAPHLRRLILERLCTDTFQVTHGDMGQRAVCQKMIKGIWGECIRTDSMRGKGAMYIQSSGKQM